MKNRIISVEVFVSVFILVFVFADGFRLLRAQSINVRLSDQQFVSKNWDNTRGLPVNTVFGVLKDDTGFLWAVTEEGLVRFDGKNFRVFNQENVPEISAPMFYDLTESTSGGVRPPMQMQLFTLMEIKLMYLKQEILWRDPG